MNPYQFLVAPPPTMGVQNPVRGHRVIPDRHPGTNFLVDRRYTLLRAEDATVPVWEVTLAPVYRNVVGPTWQGMPGRVPTTKFGQPRCEMTWGGGGVSFRVDFEFPVCGTSFGVAGDNVQLDVYFEDIAVAYTDDELPAFEGWAAEAQLTTALQPLTIQGQDGALASAPLWPFCRALIVAGGNANETISVFFNSPLGPTTVVVATNAGPTRVPVPAAAIDFTVGASAGTVSVMQELNFT